MPSSPPAASVQHSPGFAPAAPEHGIESAEALLSAWFEAPVVLTSSGRAAILLCLQQFGLNRYRDTIALPRMISACVMEAVIRQGFPLDAAHQIAASLTLHYHQYGFVQTERPNGLVLEDICHSFFATPDSGARNWTGTAAVFSLPKFFQMAGMAGGIVVPSAILANQLRDARDYAAAVAPRARQVGELADIALEHAYLDRLLNPAADANDLAGLPGGLAGLKAIGAARRRLQDQLLESSTHLPMPEGWRSMLAQALPFVFPVFADVTSLSHYNDDLYKSSVIGGLYQIDTNRTMSAPNLQPAVLLPCHGYMEVQVQFTIFESLRQFRPIG